MCANLSVFLAVFDEHAGDEDGFGNLAVALILGGLEGFARSFAEAVKIQAIVPVGPADKWKAMRTFVVDGEIDRAAEMLHKRFLAAEFVIEWGWMIQDGVIAGLLDVGGSRTNKPKRIVIEAAADISVALLG